jgi:hypothetical protein
MKGEEALDKEATSLDDSFNISAVALGGHIESF